MPLPMTITTKTGNTCTLQLVGDDYIMTGATGSHRLSAHCTDAKRLQAHWNGFVDNNGGFDDTTEPTNDTEESGYEAGDSMYLYRNQSHRDGVILAVLGDRALVEYEMPNGTSALNYIDLCGHFDNDYKSISYFALPKKWAQAMLDQQGSEAGFYYGNPQRAWRKCPTIQEILAK